MQHLKILGLIILSSLLFSCGGSGSGENPPSATSTPTNLMATVGNQQVSLSWSEVDGASYNLYYAQQSFVGLNGGISNYAALTGGTLINNIAINNHVITGLSNATAYYFVVTAVKNSTESTSSNQANATPATPVVAATGTLNDTGITWGGEYPSGNNTDCTGDTISAQDCSHGRGMCKL